MKILSICSGGIDSIAMSSLYLKEDLTLMSFFYGQKAIKESAVVKRFANLMEAKHINIDISFMKDLYGKSNQLTGENVEIKDEYDKSVVVPLRNAVFLQIAMAYAYTHEFDKVLLGSHMNDITEVDGERLYPDCSPEFFKSFELAMDLGTFKSDEKVKIESASLIGFGKTDLIKIGYERLNDEIFNTWSCYYSDEKHCGKCESCRNRKKAFQESGVEDRTEYME